VNDQDVKGLLPLPSVHVSSLKCSLANTSGELCISTPDEIFELIRANDIVFPRFLSARCSRTDSAVAERDPHKRLASAARIREHSFSKPLTGPSSAAR